MELCILLIFTTFCLIKFSDKVNAGRCLENDFGTSLKWLGCHKTPTNSSFEDIYYFELLLKADITEYVGNNKSNETDWRQSIPEFACRCAQLASEYGFKVLTLQFPSVCYGRYESFKVKDTSRRENECERQKKSKTCSQSQSLCIGLNGGISIYSIVKNTTKPGNYYTFRSSSKKKPTYKSSFSRKESLQNLQDIFSMLGQSFDVNEILNLIKRAIFILKRPDIYQDFNVYKQQEERFLDILSNIIDEPFKEMWRKSQKIHHLVTLVEDVAKTLLQSMEYSKNTNEQYHYEATNIEIMGIFTQERQARIHLNDSTISITPTGTKGALATSAIIYKRIHDVFPPAIQRSTSVSSLSTRVISPIVSITATHNGKEIHRVNGSISFKVSDYNKMHEVASFLCVYWNRNKNFTLGGAWSTGGLSLIDTYHSNHSNTTYSTCQTSHLTNFAILLEVSEYKIPESDRFALKIITYAGCAVSLCCLLLTIFTLPILRLRETRFKIHFHLCIALSIAQIVFLSGIRAVGKKIPCMVVAILLHYFFTAAFLWMFVEGFHLYQKVVIAYEKKAIKPQYYYVIAWGTPILIVGISAAIHGDGYGTTRGCWLSLKDGLRWSFIGPVIFVMTGNFVILIRVLMVMVNLRKDPLKKQKYAKIRMALKGLVILLPLLGLTWMFGLMSVNSDTIVFQYLFAIFNSLQGVFIFVFNYLLNKEVRASFRRTLHRTTTTSL